MDLFAIKNINGVLAGVLVIVVSPFLISIFFSESYNSDKFSKAFFDGIRLNIKKYFKLLGLEGSFFVAGFLLSKIFINTDTVNQYKH